MNELELYFKEPSRARFADLVRRHQESVFQTAWRVCGDRDAAEDVTEEVFLELLEAEAREVRSTRGFLAWRAIALARRHLRSRSRRRRREEEAVKARSPNAKDPEREGLSSAERLTVQDEVGNLEGDTRSSIELHYFGGLTRES